MHVGENENCFLFFCWKKPSKGEDGFGAVNGGVRGPGGAFHTNMPRRRVQVNFLDCLHNVFVPLLVDVPEKNTFMLNFEVT